MSTAALIRGLVNGAATECATIDCFLVWTLRQYNVKNYTSSTKCVILSTNSATTRFELGEGCLQHGGDEQEGGRKGCSCGPVLTCAGSWVAGHPLPCPPLLSLPLWGRLIHPNATAIPLASIWTYGDRVRGWGWMVRRSVLRNTEFLRWPDHSPSQHTVTLYDRGAMLLSKLPHTLICQSWLRDRLMGGWQTWSELRMMLRKNTWLSYFKLPCLQLPLCSPEPAHFWPFTWSNMRIIKKGHTLNKIQCVSK